MKKSLALLTVLGVAGCGGGGGGTAQTTPQATGAAQAQQQRFPGANGEIAAIDGRTLQVQSSTDQTAVTWSAKTSFTDTVSTSAAAVTVGTCVVVRDTNAAVRTTATPDPSATRPTSVTAMSVAVSPPVAGACTQGQGGGQGGGPGGPRGGFSPRPGFTPPSGAPDGLRRGFFAGGGAFGKVTSKSAQGFVVTGSLPGQNSTVTTTVTTTATTAYTTQAKVTASALKVGECVSARGTSDSTGQVAATSIAIRPKTDGSCDGGFGTRRG